MPSGHIYIIDDDVSMRHALQGALRRKGFAVRSFSAPPDFLSAIDHSSSGVIVLDVEMPQMSGLELQQELVARGMAMPIIFISGRSQPQQIIQGMKRGAVDFLLKPFELEQLISSISEALARARRAAESDDESRHLAGKFASLTRREQEILQAVGEGEKLKEIAVRLGVSNSVVKFHKSNLMHKLDCRTLSDLIATYVNLERGNAFGSSRV